MQSMLYAWAHTQSTDESKLVTSNVPRLSKAHAVQLRIPSLHEPGGISHGGRAATAQVLFPQALCWLLLHDALSGMQLHVQSGLTAESPDLLCHPGRLRLGDQQAQPSHQPSAAARPRGDHFVAGMLPPDIPGLAGPTVPGCPWHASAPTTVARQAQRLHRVEPQTPPTLAAAMRLRAWTFPGQHQGPCLRCRPAGCSASVSDIP